MRVRPRGWTAVALVAVLGAGVAACTPGAVGPETSPSPSCTAVAPSRALPADRVALGVNPDWGAETVAEFADAVGLEPAVAVSFAPLPFTQDDARNVVLAAEQVRGAGGILLLTLEPVDGLAAVTAGAADDLGSLVGDVTAAGTPVLVRFGHEMNGSWYAWGQQPEAYVAAFRRVAEALDAHAPTAETLWAPNYGGGYPFAGGAYGAPAGSPAAAVLDTDADGALTALDDPYAPYYPGDDVVDWVGMSLYHWGARHPWGANEVAEPDAFLARLTGTYAGTAGDETPVPDFVDVYATARGKPLAIPETAAFVTATAPSELELRIKRSWWQQVLAAATHEQLPGLRLVNWFDWDKLEPEVGEQVVWSVSGSPTVAAAFRADLPAWVATGADVAPCG